jgi:hypothetical protein
MQAFIKVDGPRWVAQDNGVAAEAFDDFVNGKYAHGTGRKKLFAKLEELGYTRVIIDGEVLKLALKAPERLKLEGEE